MSKLEPAAQAKGRIQKASPVRRPVAVAAQGNEDGEFSLGFLLGVWNQWWKLIIPISLMLAVGSAAIVMWTFQPKYKAEARIEIAEHAPWIISQDQGPKAQQYVATQIEILRSPRVLNACVQEEKIAEMVKNELSNKRDPIKWLSEKGLTIETLGQSTLVSISYKGTNADTASMLVNSVVDNYFKIQTDQRTMRVKKILTVLQRNKKSQSTQVARLQNLVKSLAKNLDVTPDLTGQNIVVNQTTPVQELMNQITKADFDIANLESAVTAIQISLADDSQQVSPELVNSRIDSLPEINARRQELIQEEAKLAQVEAFATGGRSSEAYVSQQAKTASLRNAIELMRTQHYDSMSEQVRALGRSGIAQELEYKRTELEQKRALMKKLSNRYELEKDKVDKEGNKRLEFDFALQELRRALSLLATISERDAQMSAELGAPGRPELYSEAAPNYEPEQKWPIVELAASTLGSLVIPFGIAIFWENTVRRISSVEQLEARTNVEVIGEVSRLPARQGRNSRVVGHELGLFEESIDSLRTSLLLSNDDEELQVIAVCSAVSGEGKTSVSSQLAVSIARATGQPVLLVDGDMRAPDVHQIFEIPLSPGLVDVLDGQKSLEDSINRTWSEHVHLLPAGELEKSPHKLLGTPAFNTLLDEARLWYRYIVIDTPPVLAASEALVIAKQADGTIVCTMRDFSRENHVQMAHHRLRATGAQTIGTVLNGVPVRNYASRYGSYGQYGYTNQKNG